MACFYGTDFVGDVMIGNIVKVDHNDVTMMSIRLNATVL